MGNTPLKRTATVKRGPRPYGSGTAWILTIYHGGKEYKCYPFSYWVNALAYARRWVGGRWNGEL